ncbi:MAG: hypothetical protein JST70_17005 [Bacteroidetes bacterium]|nr:hypothetical protein [Bacteroidota bacterium]
MEDILKFENRDQLYQFLIDDFGFKKIDERYTPEFFGDFYVLLSGAFLVMYINDRGFLTVDIASKYAPSDRYSLSILRELIHGPQKSVNQKNRDRINEYNSFLKEDYRLIENLLNKENYRKTLNKIVVLLKNQNPLI